MINDRESEEIRLCTLKVSLLCLWGKPNFNRQCKKVINTHLPHSRDVSVTRGHYLHNSLLGTDLQPDKHTNSSKLAKQRCFSKTLHCKLLSYLSEATMKLRGNNKETTFQAPKPPKNSIRISNFTRTAHLHTQTTRLPTEYVNIFRLQFNRVD